MRFNGARAFVDATHSVPSRTVVDAATPGQLHSTASENVSSLRRLKSDHVPRRRPVVVATGVESDLKKLSKRRARARVATVEAVDPDPTAEELLSESLHARLEAACRPPSFATLMSDFEAKLGNSVVNDEDIAWAFGLELESRSDSGDNSVWQDSQSRITSQGAADIPDRDGDIATSSIPSPKPRNSRSKPENTIIGVDTNVIELESRSDSGANPGQDAQLSSPRTRTKTPAADSSDDIASSSISSPTAVKRRRQRNVEGNRILKITKNPVTRRPRKLKTPEAETVKSVGSDEAPVVEERGGKRRLSLRSRIARKQSKQMDSGAAVAHSSKSLRPEDRDLWSQEVDDLINEYSTSLDLAAPLWDNLERGLLTAYEENRLAMHMKPMKKLEKLQKILTKQVGREPTDEEWASAAGVELSTLRRRLALGRAARLKLIQRNLRLVLSQAYKYYKESMSLSVQDLCQEGVVGLMQAVDKFDPGKGYRFSTYGIYWIRNSILRAQTKSGHMLRSPHNVSTHRVNIKRVRGELAAELGRQPTNEEIRNRLGITADRFRDILRTNVRPSSLHEHDRVTGREKVENLVSEEDALSTYARGTSMVLYGLDDVLDSLRPKENIVLRQRYGLDGKGQRSLSEVGLILNLSREMVRRHELRGILKLQHPTRVEYLRNYLN